MGRDRPPSPAAGGFIIIVVVVWVAFYHYIVGESARSAAAFYCLYMVGHFTGTFFIFVKVAAAVHNNHVLCIQPALSHM